MSRKRKMEEFFAKNVVVIGMKSDEENEAAKRGLLSAMLQKVEEAAPKPTTKQEG